MLMLVYLRLRSSTVVKASVTKARTFDLSEPRQRRRRRRPR